MRMVRSIRSQGADLVWCDTVRRNSASQLGSCSNEGLEYFWHVSQRYTTGSTTTILIANGSHAEGTYLVLHGSRTTRLALLA